ncbi:MAG: hypothetical protein EKK53_15325 [Burkholderiales bacterium]|nr:MAG: hypothetical protein EKK53_15325 [Burkholderiales bacterium]
MYANQRVSEGLALIGTIDPVSQAAGTVTTSWLDQSQYLVLMALVAIGAFGASATVDAKLQQATDSAGTGAKDVTGKAVTQLVAGGGNNRQVLINMKEADLDTEGGFRYVRLSITVGTAATLVFGAVFGGIPRFMPVTHQAGVAQVV